VLYKSDFLDIFWLVRDILYTLDLPIIKRSTSEKPIRRSDKILLQINVDFCAKKFLSTLIASSIMILQMAWLTGIYFDSFKQKQRILPDYSSKRGVER
jgi:hypothetical protein